MRIEIVGKNVNITPAMRDYFEKKLRKIERFIVVDDATYARILVRTYDTKHKVEVTVYAKLGILRAEVSDYDAYAAMDLAVDKLVGQVRKQKTRIVRRRRGDSVTERLIQESSENEVEDPVRSKEILLEPMTVDDAIVNMELVGHTFYLFLDEESGNVSVVYRRKAGGYGMIEGICADNGLIVV